MKSILYFILLFVILGSSNLFAVEQSKKNESSINQEDESKGNTDAESADKENKTSTLLSELKESTDQDSTDVIDEEIPSISEIKESTDQDSTDVINEEVSSSNESTHINLQPEEEISIKDTEFSTSPLLEEKKEEQPNKIRPVNKEDEESEKWTKLNKEITKKWDHKSKSIYKRQYDSLNEHLPKTIFTDDYSKQFFYCIKKGNLICLRGVINKLEKIGLTIQEILRFKNKLGDTSLIYAVKQGQIDTVRFLLLQGADPRAVNNNFKSPIDIAIERKQINIINAIAEMIPYLSEDKEIQNEESSDMYNFAIKTKENTCDAKDN